MGDKPHDHAQRPEKSQAEALRHYLRVSSGLHPPPAPSSSPEASLSLPPCRGFKRADREIVALDFLLNIPMKNEGQILQQARQHVPASDSKSILTGAAQEEEPIDLLDSPAAFTPGPAGATISDLSVIVATDG